MTSISRLESEPSGLDQKLVFLRRVFSAQTNQGFQNRCRLILENLCYLNGLRLLTCDKSQFSLSEKEIAIFNKAANLYNLALSDRLSSFCTSLEYRKDINFACLALYFSANQAIMRRDVEAAKACLCKGLLTAKGSKKADLFTMMFASPLARLYLMAGDNDELQTFLIECFMTFELKGKFVSGRFLGWLFYIRAQEQFSQCKSLDLSNDKPLREYVTCTNKAIGFLEYAIDAFNNDETEDKLFGKAYCLCLLILCTLGCGEDGSTRDLIETPYPNIMRSVHKYLEEMEQCPTRHCVVIQILHEMAKTDYFYRIRQFQQAFESAGKAAELSKCYKCAEFVGITNKRRELYGIGLGSSERHD